MCAAKIECSKRTCRMVYLHVCTRERQHAMNIQTYAHYADSGIRTEAFSAAINALHAGDAACVQPWADPLTSRSKYV